MDTTKAVEWLKQHGASERSFARALQSFFRQQADSIAAAVIDEGIHVPLPLLFNAHDWHDKLLPLARRNVSVLMATGATSELNALRGAEKLKRQSTQRTPNTWSDSTCRRQR